MQGGPGPGGLPPPPLRSFAGLRDSPIFNEATFQVLLERVGHLEQYKAHLEKENKEMHQQLQVLSGFLNVVATSVRTTENMLFSAPDDSPREAAPPPLPGNLLPTSSNSQQALAGVRRKAPGPPGASDDLPSAGAAAAAAAGGGPLPPQLAPGPGVMGPGAAGLKRPRLDAGPLPRPLIPMDAGPPLRPPMPLLPSMLPPPRSGGAPFFSNSSSNSGGQISLRLTRVKGTSALNGDPVSIYRIELLRDGYFDKYLYLPNDSIVLYGLRVWQHREAIPNEIIKMVENCLTTRSVASEQLTEEVRHMKTILSQQCPHLTRWGWGSNKVRLVNQMGLRDLVSRIHRTMQKNSQVTLPSLADGYLGWLDDPQAQQVPARAWTAPVYSRRPPNEDAADTPPPTISPAAVAAAAAAQAAAIASGAAGLPPLPPQAPVGVAGGGAPLPGPDLQQQAPAPADAGAADGEEPYQQQEERAGGSSAAAGARGSLDRPEPLANGHPAAAAGAGRVGSASSLTTTSEPAVGVGRLLAGRRQGRGPSSEGNELQSPEGGRVAPLPDSPPTPEEEAVEAEAAAGLTALGATAPLRLPVRHSMTDSAPSAHPQQLQQPRGGGAEPGPIKRGSSASGAPYPSPTAAMAAAAAAAAAASGLDPCALALDASTWLAQLNQFASQFGLSANSQPQHSSAQ